MYVDRVDVVQVLNEIKTGKASGPSYVPLIAASSILVMWVGCWFQGITTDASNPGSKCMLCPWARHLIRIASVDSADK